MNQSNLKEKASNECQARNSHPVLRTGKQPTGAKQGETANQYQARESSHQN